VEVKVHIFYNCLLAALKPVLYRVGYDAVWTEVSANCDERKIPPFSGIPNELSELQSVSSLIQIYDIRQLEANADPPAVNICYRK
jgi:hypothetical protein